MDIKGFQQDGIYSGFVIQKRVEVPVDKQTKERRKGNLRLVALCRADQILDDATKLFVQLDTVIEDVAFISLITERNGANTHQIDALKGAFDWGGADLMELHSSDYSKKRVQFVVKFMTNQDGTLVYDEKTKTPRLKVDWIQRHGGAGLKSATKDDLAAAMGEWQSIFGAAAVPGAPAGEANGPAAECFGSNPY